MYAQINILYICLFVYITCTLLLLYSYFIKMISPRCSSRVLLKSYLELPLLLRALSRVLSRCGGSCGTVHLSKQSHRKTLKFFLINVNENSLLLTEQIKFIFMAL